MGEYRHGSMRSARRSAPAMTMALAIALVAAVLATVSAGAQEPNGGVRLNEIVASNSTGLLDEDGESSDWIELHNPSSDSINIGGWSLSDDEANPGLWTLPDGLSLDAGGYVVIFASAKDRRAANSELHTNFKLSAGGEFLGLFDAVGVAVDSFAPTYPAQSTDVSWGIDGDGGQAFFAEPSPGAPNSGPEILDDVAFSQPHGFYDAPITLTLASSDPAATIRYSLDGSDPTSGSVYNGSLNVSSTATVRAIAQRNGQQSSRIATQTYLFLDDVIDQGTTPPGFPTSAVNGQVFDWGMDPDVVDGQEAAVRNSLLSIPTISLVTDLDHLFDSGSGIYVNAAQDGRDWERPASFEIIHPDGADAGVDANAGIRIRGGASRRASNPKHSFRIFFRSEYGDANLDYRLFGNDGAASFDKIDLRSAQNYSWSGTPTSRSYQNTMLTERWSRETQGAMGQLNTRSDHYHLYLNGQYFGVVQTQERVSKDFAEEYLGGDDDDYDVVKHDRNNGYRFDMVDGTDEAWRELWAMISDSSVSNAEFASIAEMVDLGNLADYFLLHFYSGDFDGAPSWFLAQDGQRYVRANNWYGLRNRVDGKWQFFDHDSEHSLCVRGVGPNQSENIDNTNFVLGAANPVWSADYFNPGWLHGVLLANDHYRQIFADRVQLHLLDDGGALTTAESQARLDGLANTVRPAVLAHSARWGDAQSAQPQGLTQWEAVIDYIRSTCFPARANVVAAQLADDGLFPTLAPPTFSAEGAVAWDQTVTIDGPGGSSILYTLDGSDPLGINGQPSAGAVASSTVKITDYVTVTARARDGSDWSAPRQATFSLTSLPASPSLLLNEFNAVDSSVPLANGAADPVFGDANGNGGDWFELVVLDEDLDLRGWQLEIQDAKSGELVTRDRLVFADAAELSSIAAGTIITVSESLPDNLSLNPAADDWAINLQANTAGDGAFFTADSQANFDTNEHDWQLIIRDSEGQVVTLRTGEGAGALTGVSDNEVGKLEATPTTSITPDSNYDDGSSSTFGLPNRWDQELQDFSDLRFIAGDADSSGTVDGADVQALLNQNVGLPGPAINTAAADINNDGQITLLDALIIAQSVSG